MTEFIHAVRADVPEGYSVGPPTDGDLALINERIALMPQAADMLFVWPLEISNNRTDSHATWMDASSLNNYARQANAMRGIPYLRHHDTYSDERGRVFRGELVDGGPMVPAKGGTPLARDLFREPEPVVSLIETAFMRRGLMMHGTSNDDLIANIEAGIAASNSIGFSVYSPSSPGSYLECDICGVDIFLRGADGVFVCPHIPALEYYVPAPGNEDPSPDELVRCVATARVVNATQREASGVYLGSTPGTYTLAGRAHDLYVAGRASADDARRLEDVLCLERGMVTLGRPEAVHSIPKRITSGAISNPTADPLPTARTGGDERRDEGDMSTYDAVARVREVLADDPDRLAAIELADVSLATDPVGALYTALTDAVSRAEDERDKATAADAEFRRAMRERLSLDDGEDIAAGLDRLAADASVAREYRGELTAELLRQMTRAGLVYDEPEQRALADRLTPAQVKSQTAMYRETANKALPPGRVSEPELQARKPAPVRRPAYAG